MIYGYLRVSTEEQNLERQLDALKKFAKENNIKIDEIVQEKKSGKNTCDRKGFLDLFERLQEGDTLIIKEIDRLGRNYEEIKSVWQQLSDRNIYIEVLEMPLLSTRIENKATLDKKFVANLVFEILCYLAEKERLKISNRTKEGLASKKAQGVLLGRPKMKIQPPLLSSIKNDLQTNMILPEIASHNRISLSKLKQILKDYAEELNYQGRTTGRKTGMKVAY